MNENPYVLAIHATRALFGLRGDQNVEHMPAPARTVFYHRVRQHMNPLREHISPAMERADRRLFLKREANKLIPDGSRYTRQQARADKRRTMKDLRSMRKVHALKNGTPGGAAVIA